MRPSIKSKVFEETVTCNLTAEEKKSKAIKFFGWAIFNTLKRFKKDGAANKNGRNLAGYYCVTLL